MEFVGIDKPSSTHLDESAGGSVLVALTMRPSNGILGLEWQAGGLDLVQPGEGN